MTTPIMGDESDDQPWRKIYQKSAAVLYTLGGVQAAADLTNDAIDSFSNGMDMAPDDWKPFFQSELDRLTNQKEQGEDP
ncbi:MAG: hypothetical protein IID58_11275 [Proteobacteria bacterium]|nr:hypothetical protein [Pseudomonadota bacterium]